MLSLKILESLVNLGNGRIKAPVLKCNSSDAFIYNEPKIVQKPFKDCFTRSRSRVSKAANRSNKNLNDERKRARPQNILWDLGKIFEILVKSYGFSREGKKFHQWLYNRGVFAANMCFWPLSTRKRSLREGELSTCGSGSKGNHWTQTGSLHSNLYEELPDNCSACGHSSYQEVMFRWQVDGDQVYLSSPV